MPRAHNNGNRILPDRRLKLEKFAGIYMTNGGNAAKAAVAADLADEKHAAVEGHRALKYAYVQQLIEEHRERVAADLEARYAITRENVLDALANLVMGSPKDLFHPDGRMKGIHELDDRTAKMISSMDVEEIWEGQGKDRCQVGLLKKVRLWDKNSAIDKAMRHLGLFEKDNTQKPAVVQLTRDDAGVL
jgi:phage terminase small subunit